MVHDFMELLGNPMFLLLGGIIFMVVVAIIVDGINKSQKLRVQEREKDRQREVESHRALMGLTESDDIAGLKLRIEALEQDVARLEGLLAGTSSRRVTPASTSAQGAVQPEQLVDA